MHKYISQKVASAPVNLELDGHALSFFNGLQAGVTAFLHDNPQLCKFTRQKILFYRSDLLRQCVTLMRINDYLLHGGSEEKPRVLIGIPEIVLGWQRLMRQWELHCSVYRHCDKKRPRRSEVNEDIDAVQPERTEPWSQS